MRYLKLWKYKLYKLHKLHILLVLSFLPAAVFFGSALTLQAAEEAKKAEAAAGEDEDVLAQYKEYQELLASIEYRADIAGNGFTVVEEQIFPVSIGGFGEVSMIPAFDEKYNRLALFFADSGGKVIYRTDRLETNNRAAGQMKQPDCEIAAVSFRDLDGDRRMDIILITSGIGTDGSLKGKNYKVGDVLFQSKVQAGFYRDYRIVDKINRYGMNKSAELITAFVRDGDSTEFLYTAAALDELFAEGMQIITEQCYFRTFEKMGRLQVVPGTYRISDYDVFMIYLVNEQGDIVSSLQPMGNYDSLYALKGIKCQDIDGDGLKDIVVLARYSSVGESDGFSVESDYSIYYQRTGGFSADTEIKKRYRCSDEDTMELLVEKARAYWGWQAETEKTAD